MNTNIQALNVFTTHIFQSQIIYVVGLIILSLVLLGIIILLVSKYKKQQMELLKLYNEIKEEQFISQLKEQEIKSFEKTLKAHEKERLKIANMLYDKLSVQMSTLKRHFNDIEDENIKNQYQDIDNLIEEAYQTIRHISEAKNYGMLADEGFFEALKKLADNILNTYDIQVKVHKNGLNQRLENSKEVILLRIINELVNNVIQHAKATEVDIHINGHDTTLNIKVVDNGKGFNTSQITKNETGGIGLKSIDRRVENLQGKMTIESRMGVGTSAIIDVPI